MNYYQASSTKPFHLSVGAIVLDENGNILCEHYDKLNEWEDIYWLMHSTINPNETLEQALHRGLKEEMGVTGEIISFVGVHNYKSEWFGETSSPVEVTKSIAYFTVRLISADESLKSQDNSAYNSRVVALTKKELIQKMKIQYQKYLIDELDESRVLAQ